MITKFLRLLASTLTITPLYANAACFGSGSYMTCNDGANTYSVSRFGNTTMVNGSGPNGTWSQNTIRAGNMAYTNGTAENGANWTETQTNFGGTVMTNGVNSQGRSYSHTCTSFGCN